jgi:hypothetical protein
LTCSDTRLESDQRDVDLAVDAQLLATSPPTNFSDSLASCRVFEPSENIEEPAKSATMVKTACRCAETLD